MPTESTARSIGPRPGFWALALIAVLGLSAFLSRTAAGPELVAWDSDFEAALAEAALTGQPVLVDFSADWCRACRQMKRGVYSDNQVAEAIEQGFQAVRIDMTRPGPTQTELAERYAVIALPTLLILGPDGRVRGEAGILTKSEFLPWLNAHGPTTDGERRGTRNGERGQIIVSISPFLAPRSSFLVPRSSFPVPRSSFLSNRSKGSKNVLLPPQLD